jgi:hypothetical protein
MKLATSFDTLRKIGMENVVISVESETVVFRYCARIDVYFFVLRLFNFLLPRMTQETPQFKLVLVGDGGVGQ